MAEALLKTRTQHNIIESNERAKERIIDGLFYELWNGQVTYFTGIFHYCKGEGYDAIDGLLEDNYGRSRIEGLLSEQKTLSFNKTYGGKPPIEYKFSFDKESGLYIGAWKGKDAFEGHSVCKLDNILTQPDSDFILNYFKSFDAMSDEERAQAIIGYMVGEGQLNVSRDSTSGELMFSLSEEGKRLAEESSRNMTPKEKKVIDDVVNQAIREVDKDEDDIPF